MIDIQRTSGKRRESVGSRRIAALWLGLLVCGCYGVVDDEGIAAVDGGGPGNGGAGGSSSGGATTGGGNGSGGATGTGGATGRGGSGTGGSATGTGGAGTGGSSTGTGGSGTGGATGGTAGSTDAGTGKGGAAGSGGSSGTGGASGASGAAGAGGTFGVPATCTSMTTWTTGNNETMRPGDACVACHSTFTIAGTVYPTAHEPTNCNGKSGVQVVITPASGTALTLTTNAAGNFYSTAKVATPYSAKIVVNGAERPMMAKQTTGNCNSCHTQNGAQSAPGRIVVP